MLSSSIISMATAITAMLAFTSAAPIETPNLDKRDGVMFTLSVNDVQGNMPGYDKAPIQAQHGGFYVGGGPPTTACPPSGPCPHSNQTVFQCVADNANTTCYLATQSGKQPIYLDGGALLYAPTYMYGHLTPALFPQFEHTSDTLLSSQVYGKNGEAFFNENWFGCTSTNTLNPQYAIPYQLYFAISSGAKCPNRGAWIQITATPVSAATEYAYTN